MDVKWAAQKAGKYIQEAIPAAAAESGPQNSTGRALPPVGTLVVMPPAGGWDEEIKVVLSSHARKPEAITVEIESVRANAIRVSAIEDEYFDWITDDFSMWIL